MSDKTLPDKGIPSLDRRQAPPRRDILGGTVTTAERAEVLRAFEQAGFRTISQGVRVLALAFARSTEVRDAIAGWYHQHLEEAA